MLAFNKLRLEKPQEFRNLESFVDVKNIPEQLSILKYDEFLPVEIELSELYLSTTKRMEMLRKISDK